MLRCLKRVEIAKIILESDGCVKLSRSVCICDSVHGRGRPNRLRIGKTLKWVRVAALINHPGIFDRMKPQNIVQETPNDEGPKAVCTSIFYGVNFFGAHAAHIFTNLNRTLAVAALHIPIHLAGGVHYDCQSYE